MFSTSANSVRASKVATANNLIFVPQASFSQMVPWLRTKQKWDDYGSLEHQINSKFNVEHRPPIHKDSRRCGAIGYKIGMMTIWDKWGVAIPCTVIQIDRCQVTQIKMNVNKHGDHTIQVGAGQANLDKVNKPQIGHCMKIGVPIKRHFAEFKVTRDNFLPTGYMIGPSYFKIGNFVDVIGTSKGKGFQGVIKRWNFRHQYFTHGNSLSHRAPGALQGCERPGRVFKGKKMAGQLGNESSVQFSCKVIRVDNPKSLIYVKGPIPGPIGGMVKIRDAHKKMTKQKRAVNEDNTGIDTWPGELLDPYEQYEHENEGVAGPDAEDD